MQAVIGILILVAVASANKAQHSAICEDHPCLHGASCFPRAKPTWTGRLYTCLCLGDYGGFNCEIRDPCSGCPKSDKSVFCVRTGNRSTGRICYDHELELMEKRESEPANNVVTPVLEDEKPGKPGRARPLPITQQPGETDAEFYARVKALLEVLGKAPKGGPGGRKGGRKGRPGKHGAGSQMSNSMESNSVESNSVEEQQGADEEQVLKVLRALSKMAPPAGEEAEVEPASPSQVEPASPSQVEPASPSQESSQESYPSSMSQESLEGADNGSESEEEEMNILRPESGKNPKIGKVHHNKPKVHKPKVHKPNKVHHRKPKPTEA